MGRGGLIGSSMLSGLGQGLQRGLGQMQQGLTQRMLLDERQKWDRESLRLRQVYQTSERKAGQAYTTSERVAGQAYSISDREADESYSTSERKAEQDFTTSERGGKQEHEIALAGIGKPITELDTSKTALNKQKLEDLKREAEKTTDGALTDKQRKQQITNKGAAASQLRSKRTRLMDKRERASPGKEQETFQAQIDAIDKQLAVFVGEIVALADPSSKAPYQGHPYKGAMGYYTGQTPKPGAQAAPSFTLPPEHGGPAVEGSPPPATPAPAGSVSEIEEIDQKSEIEEIDQKIEKLKAQGHTSPMILGGLMGERRSKEREREKIPERVRKAYKALEKGPTGGIGHLKFPTLGALKKELTVAKKRALALGYSEIQIAQFEQGGQSSAVARLPSANGLIGSKKKTETGPLAAIGSALAPAEASAAIPPATIPSSPPPSSLSGTGMLGRKSPLSSSTPAPPSDPEERAKQVNKILSAPTPTGSVEEYTVPPDFSGTGAEWVERMRGQDVLKLQQFHEGPRPRLSDIMESDELHANAETETDKKNAIIMEYIDSSGWTSQDEVKYQKWEDANFNDKTRWMLGQNNWRRFWKDVQNPANIRKYAGKNVSIATQRSLLLNESAFPSTLKRQEKDEARRLDMERHRYRKDKSPPQRSTGIS